MRRLRPWAIVAWLGSAASGCSTIAGLDSIQEQDCAPFCEDATPGDSTATSDHASGDDSALRPDRATSALDSWSEHSSEAEAAPSRDAWAEAVVGYDAPVIVPDAAHEAASDSSPTDVLVGSHLDAEAGCGPLDVVTNCSACGAMCNPVHAANPRCDGMTCSYACNPGYLDCNFGTAPPDTDGCECHAPGAPADTRCCSGGCPIAHNYDQDITIGTFYDCVAAGTYNGTLAMDACTAYAGTGNCSAWTCSSYQDGGLIADMVCSDGPTAPACACWAFDGDIPGQMVVGPGTATVDSNNCQCPMATDPHWN
jgi:hypothetical protein